MEGGRERGNSHLIGGKSGEQIAGREWRHDVDHSIGRRRNPRRHRLGASKFLWDEEKYALILWKEEEEVMEEEKSMIIK